MPEDERHDEHVVELACDGDEIRHEVERQTELVKPAIAEDPVYPYSFDDFLAIVDSLTDFAQRRSSYVSCEVAQMENPSDEPQEACSTFTGQ